MNRFPFCKAFNLCFLRGSFVPNASVKQMCMILMCFERPYGISQKKHEKKKKRMKKEEETKTVMFVFFVKHVLLLWGLLSSVTPVVLLVSFYTSQKK